MQLKKYYICEFYNLILKTFEKGKVIRVPLRENKPGNELRKQWELIIDMKEASDKVEEILAVRSSLVRGLHEGLITHKELNVKTEQYNKAYSEFISGYAEAYEEFECIAKKIGETAAAGLIFHVLNACHPGIAFKHTMSAIHKIDSRDRDFLRNLWRGPLKDAIRQMFGFFDKLTDQLDPDNYFAIEQMRTLDVEENIKRKFSALSKELENDSTNFLFLSLNEFLLSHYTAEYSPFGYIRLDFSLRELESDQKNHKLQELSSRQIVLLLEAIRQQLTTGIGLLCPFWANSAPDCCGGRNRELLEKVWSCTQRNSAFERWKRLGCLNEGRCYMPCGGNSLKIKY
jgi:hypothetical protein